MNSGAGQESHAANEPPGADPRGKDRLPLAGQPDGEAVKPLDARVRQLWWTSASLLALATVAVAGTVDALVALPTPPGVLTGGVAVVAAALAALLPAVRYRRWRYALRERDLWIRQGVVWVTVSVIPFSRLQFVDTRQGPLDRLFGLSQLVVHTAALGTSGQLPGLDAEEAERLRARLAQVQPDESASV